jgi:hypothetical protein
MFVPLSHVAGFKGTRSVMMLSIDDSPPAVKTVTQVVTRVQRAQSVALLDKVLRRRQSAYLYSAPAKTSIHDLYPVAEFSSADVGPDAPRGKKGQKSNQSFDNYLVQVQPPHFCTNITLD